MSITLTKDQENAVDTFIDFLANPKEKFLIISGGAGVGKSTLIKELAKIVEQRKEMYSLLLKTNKHESDFEMLLTATTNPAVEVLSDLSHMEASTIHSLIGLTVRNDYTTGKTILSLKKNASPLHNKLIVIDESSMLDDLTKDKIDHQTPNCKIVLIGDQDQLAPVGHTSSVMETIKCPKVEMHQVMRNSGIITKAAAQFKKTVRDGIFNPIPTDTVNLVSTDGPKFKEVMDSVFKYTNSDFQEARILAWTNDRVVMYNKYIRELKGLPEDFQVGETVFTNNFIKASKMAIRVDSPVVITGMGNKYSINNIQGRDIELNNRIYSFLPDNPKATKIHLQNLAKKKDWTNYFDVKDTWLDLRLPYASTVHKAQGSSYNKVFIDLPDIGKCRIASDVARMIHVAISRSRQNVYLYGSLPSKYC